MELKGKNKFNDHNHPKFWMIMVIKELSDISFFDFFK